MLGYQHKRMGVAAGAGVLAYTILAQAPPELSLIMVTAPLGAMLPDIDHDQSKIGKTRKNVFAFVKFLSITALIGFVIFSYVSNGILSALLNLAYIGGMVILINIIERNKHIKKQLGFITKHRGIMHTLIPTVFIFGTTFWTSSSYCAYLIIGLAYGTIVHLLGDMATTEGAPILWPITKVNIRYLKLNTGKHSGILDIVCYIWCAIFIGVGVYFGVKGGF